MSLSQITDISLCGSITCVIYAQALILTISVTDSPQGISHKKSVKNIHANYPTSLSVIHISTAYKCCITYYYQGGNLSYVI